MQLLNDGCERAQSCKSREQGDVCDTLILSRKYFVVVEIHVHLSPKLTSRHTSDVLSVKHIDEYIKTTAETGTAS
jgi:hypothetical protein